MRYAFTCSNVLLHSLRYYGQLSAFQRLLTLFANEVVAKTRDIVGDDLLDDPLKVGVHCCIAHLARRNRKKKGNPHTNHRHTTT